MDVAPFRLTYHCLGPCRRTLKPSARLAAHRAPRETKQVTGGHREWLARAPSLRPSRPRNLLCMNRCGYRPYSRKEALECDTVGPAPWIVDHEARVAPQSTFSSLMSACGWDRLQDQGPPLGGSERLRKDDDQGHQEHEAPRDGPDEHPQPPLGRRGREAADRLFRGEVTTDGASRRRPPAWRGGRRGDLGRERPAGGTTAASSTTEGTPTAVRRTARGAAGGAERRDRRAHAAPWSRPRSGSDPAAGG